MGGVAATLGSARASRAGDRAFAIAKLFRKEKFVLAMAPKPAREARALPRAENADEYLADHPQLLPTLAQWQHAEWGYLRRGDFVEGFTHSERFYANPGWSLQEHTAYREQNVAIMTYRP
jgi:hypothetical protein